MFNFTIAVAVLGGLACIAVWSAVLWLIVTELVAWCRS